LGAPPGKHPPAGPLSQWLSLMLAEIARKREERERALAEQAQRSNETPSQRPRADDAPRR